MLTHDYLQRFTFEDHGIRGELVFLRDVFQTVNQQRPYPFAVKQLIGQTMSATALLSATIKYKGSLILQAQTNGPVNLLVAQCNEQLDMRALARWQDDADFSGSLLGDGNLVITISSDNFTAPYQGVVALSSPRLSENLENYFEQSEQLPTRLWLAANETQAVGLLLQKMPALQSGEQAAGDEWDYWQHIETLAETITEQELLSLDVATILHRLFHEEDIRLYDAQAVNFRCKCSKEKMSQALQTMGKEEVDAILSAHNLVEVTCEFCNNTYAFTQPDIDEVFSEQDR